MTSNPPEIKDYKAINGLYYPKAAKKEYFFPMGAPVFNDRVYRIGRWTTDMFPEAFKSGTIDFDLIKLDEGIELKPGDDMQRPASFDNRGVHRLLNGIILPLLIFPDTDFKTLTEGS